MYIYYSHKGSSLRPHFFFAIESFNFILEKDSFGLLSICLLLFDCYISLCLWSDGPSKLALGQAFLVWSRKEQLEASWHFTADHAKTSHGSLGRSTTRLLAQPPKWLEERSWHACPGKFPGFPGGSTFQVQAFGHLAQSGAVCQMCPFERAHGNWQVIWDCPWTGPNGPSDHSLYVLFNVWPQRKAHLVITVAFVDMLLRDMRF